MAKLLLSSTLILFLAFFMAACSRDDQRAEGSGAADNTLAGRAEEPPRAPADPEDTWAGHPDDPAAPRAGRLQPDREPTTTQTRPPTADHDDHAWADADRADREDPRAPARNWLMFAFIGIVIAAVLAAALFYRRA
jgi:hypothetical protein